MARKGTPEPLEASLKWSKRDATNPAVIELGLCVRVGKTEEERIIRLDFAGMGNEEAEELAEALADMIGENTEVDAE